MANSHVAATWRTPHQIACTFTSLGLCANCTTQYRWHGCIAKQCSDDMPAPPHSVLGIPRTASPEEVGCFIALASFINWIEHRYGIPNSKLKCLLICGGAGETGVPQEKPAVPPRPLPPCTAAGGGEGIQGARRGLRLAIWTLVASPIRFRCTGRLQRQPLLVMQACISGKSHAKHPYGFLQAPLPATGASRRGIQAGRVATGAAGPLLGRLVASPMRAWQSHCASQWWSWA